MKLTAFGLAAMLAGGIGSIGDAAAQRRGAEVNQALRELGAETIRAIDYDICYPATAEEYAALGKNAVLMLTSSSAISTELPLRSAYVVVQGVRIPLQRFALLERQVEPGSSRVTQVSFYLLPIQAMKRDSQLLADFNGERTGFSLTHFSATRGLDDNAPAFARLDEYDTPGDADPAAVARLLAREYPDYFTEQGEARAPQR